MKWKWLLMKINPSICRKISKETKFYLEHIIIYFERTFLVINVIKYLIKGGSHSKQAWVDILSLLYAISLKHHEMRKHDNAMLGHPDMFWFDTRGVIHFNKYQSNDPKKIECTSSRVVQVLWDGMYYGTLSTAHLWNMCAEKLRIFFRSAHSTVVP